MGSVLDAAARIAGEQPALIGDFGTTNWHDLARRVAAVAARLHGARPQALALRPDRDDLVVLLAHAVAGVPLLPLHPALPEAEAQRLAAAAGARRSTVAQCLEGPPAAAPARAVAAADDLCLVATSGSSGEPKLARLSHRALLAAAAALDDRLPFGAGDRWILTLPLSHVGGLSVVVRCLLARRPIVLVPRYADEAIWTAIGRDGGTRLSAVPAIADRLLAADRSGLLTRLSLVMLGGQAAPLALRRGLAEAGVPAVASYGLTETCAAAACEHPAEAGRLLPGSGSALPGVEIAVTDADGAPLAAGEPGQIRIAAAALFSGYAGRGVAPFDAAGRYDTGDLGWLDERGRLHVQGRRAEVIVSGGEKIVPGVVEAALREHPAVRDAVVFGVPDARWGAIVCAAVEGPAALVADPTLAALLSRLLPPWSRPRRWACFDALPRLANGKIDRRGCAAQAAQRWGFGAPLD
ncbi:MAG: long-chain fatty acid--CoA ligase [Burkholderiales bacterium]|nr:long-chain fatty acid--CoA ligase [Burkholderiales bacterium]